MGNVHEVGIAGLEIIPPDIVYLHNVVTGMGGYKAIEKIIVALQPLIKATAKVRAHNGFNIGIGSGYRLQRAPGNSVGNQTEGGEELHGG